MRLLTSLLIEENLIIFSGECLNPKEFPANFNIL